MHHDESKEEAQEASKALAALLSEKRVAEAAHEEWLGDAASSRLKPSIIAKADAAHSARMTDMDDEILRLKQDMKVSIFQLPDGPVDLGKMTDRNLSGWRSVSMEQRRDLLKTLFERITVDRAGQGKRFDSARINYTYTALGRKLAERWADAEAEMLTA
jgi:hypothetical protein